MQQIEEYRNQKYSIAKQAIVAWGPVYEEFYDKQKPNNRDIAYVW